MKRIILTAIVAIFLGFAATAQENNSGTAPDFLPLQNNMTLDTGQEVYNYWCAACHLPGKPGSVAVMMLRGEQMPTDLSDSTHLSADYVRHLVRNGQSVMPHFRKTQISDAQLDALVEYLATSAE